MKHTSKKKLNSVTLLALLALTLTFPVFAQAQGLPLITGVVTDRDSGQPLANARVFFYGSAYGTVFTDGTGRYTFTENDLTLFGGAISGHPVRRNHGLL